MNKEELKRKVCEAIDGRRDEIIRIGESILRKPETGFKEFETARLVAQQFELLGLAPQTGLAIRSVERKSSGMLATPASPFFSKTAEAKKSKNSTGSHRVPPPVSGAAPLLRHQREGRG